MGQGSNIYVLCAEPKEHKHFCPGTRPGRTGDQGDQDIVYVPNVYVPFLASSNSDFWTSTSGSQEGVFWERGLFRKVHFVEILENLEILENAQTVANNGESDHFLEILENLEKLEILEIPPVKRPLS